MEQLAQAFGYALGAAILLVGKNLFDLVFKYIKQKKINTIFKRSINTSAIINEELSIIRDKFGFSRVSLIDYHNGTENFKGLSFKNVSMRNEVVDIKTSRMIGEFQNIPCSIVADMLVKLEESKKGYVVVGDDGDDQTSITHRMYGVKQSYNFKLGKTLVDGVVSCAFTDNKYDLTQDEIIEIKAIVQKIYLLRNKGK